MNEREIEMAIKAVDMLLQCRELECFCGGTTTEEASALYGARDALEIELRRVRARRPA